MRLSNQIKWLFLSVLAIAPANTLLMAIQESGGKMRSVKDGVYSIEQAKRGLQVYRKSCLKCHHPKQFTGPAYMDSWAGASIHDFLKVIRRTMPTENPGSLKPGQYTAIIAFLLKINSFPPGDKKMSSKSADLKQIRIEGPFNWTKPTKKSDNEG
ncbi:MAG TPA: cytochrome c [Candidatus Marinimicrobia bacterium]|nr:cytochrome c [Candidatus Neomarinimicrobiota bacterium]